MLRIATFSLLLSLVCLGCDSSSSKMKSPETQNRSTNVPSQGEEVGSTKTIAKRESKSLVPKQASPEKEGELQLAHVADATANKEQEAQQYESNRQEAPEKSETDRLVDDAIARVPNNFEGDLPMDIPANWIRMDKFYEIWIDPDKKQVIVGGRICLREGALEMFACPPNTKEHESIVSLYVRSQLVHAGLLAIGMEPGHPVVWGEEDMTPAEGPIVEINVLWNDGKEQIIRRAQDMIIRASTRERMEEKWVFGGSQLVHDEETGENYYLADGGELVCVSNFSSALMDLPVASSASGDLTFLAKKESIPEVGTRVMVFFQAEEK